MFEKHAFTFGTAPPELFILVFMLHLTWKIGSILTSGIFIERIQHSIMKENSSTE